MLAKKGDCKGDCGYKDVYIVNKTRMLCNRCNYLRINGADAIVEKQKKNSLLSGKIKNYGKIKQKSVKQTKKDAVYALVKKELIEELKGDEEYYCKGCGNPNNLSLSHLVRRSKDTNLIALKDNMTIHCLTRIDGSEGCHGLWEQIGEMSKLEDFNRNMGVIRRIDPETYWLIIGKLRGLGEQINTNLHKEE